MPTINASGFDFDRDRYLDKTQINIFGNSIKDRLTNLVSYPFQSISKPNNAFNKRFRYITFLAIFCLKIFALSAIIGAAVPAVRHWNFSLIS